MSNTSDSLDRDPLLPCPPWWKVLARAECASRGITQIKLAEMVGGSQAAISDALSLGERGRPQSRYVTSISRVLEIALPAHTVDEQDSSEVVARLLAAATTLGRRNPALLRSQADLLEQLVASLKPNPDDE